jgi:glycyl-tRNA synthetase beta chain
MTDFLLELRSEEIPARMQDKARDDLARLFAAELAKAGLTAAALVTYATPRRLVLIARDLPDATAGVSEEVKGPKASAPPQALEGFLRKIGLTRDQLVERDGVLFAVIDKAGQPTVHVLHNAIQTVVHKFPWPKSMRWGAESSRTTSLRWVRPLHGIVALFGNDVVPGRIELQPGVSGGDAIEFGASTLGHRFHHPGQITIGSAADYVEKLRACHVIVDQDERRTLIRDRASALAEEAGLVLVEDEGLVAENAGLTEWPVPLLGRFDADFLTVPPEVIQLTARVNQKYFVCRDTDGALANAFVCTANIEATDGGAKIVDGNRKVLAARLSDARFFYETDLKTRLGDLRPKLEQIVFHEKLGTVADKVDRVARLARWLVEEGIVGAEKPLLFRGGVGVEDSTAAGLRETSPTPNPSPEGEGLSTLADMAERAARLAKADLVTGMVGEFPELQGLMGGYYAAAQGEPQEVADAIRDHYKPVGQGDDVPTAPVTVAVSLADKLDTLVAFFAIGEPPTGSKDPFAIRRAVLGGGRLILANDLRVSFKELLKAALDRLSLHAVKAYLPSESHYMADMWYEAKTSDRPYQLSESGAPFRLQENGLNRDWFSVELGQTMAWVIAFQAYAEAQTDTIFEFATDRLKVQQREAGVRHDLIDAVFALGGEDDLVRLLARVRALQAFVTTEDGTNLLAGYKRAANILKKEGYAQAIAPADAGAQGEDGLRGPGLLRGQEHKALSYTPEIAEAALIAALDAAEPAAASAVAREDFEGAMAALASLRAPIDAFFDNVTVNDPDADKRAARLALLARVRAAVHAVADFSKIEG